MERVRVHFSFSFLFFILFTPFLSCSASDDSVESLIQEQKQAADSWQESDEELPVVLLPGDKESVDICSPSDAQTTDNALCQPFGFDELIQLSNGKIGDLETPLNTDLPRVRDMLSNFCLVRPGDPFLAVGAGWQERRRVKGFLVKRDRPDCPNGSPYSLWVTLDQPLNEAPLFFSTDRKISEGGNGFIQAADLPVYKSDRQFSLRLSKTVHFSDEFQTRAMQIDGSTGPVIVELHRRLSTPDDDGLPNAQLVYQSTTTTTLLWTESVDIKKGSGNVHVSGVFDYQHDGWTDLFIEGEKAGCPFAVVLEGSSPGFNPSVLIQKPCVCH